VIISMAPTERECKGCSVKFTTTDKRQWFHTRGCGRAKREPQTNQWYLVNKPHLPTEPCLNCDEPVVQYRKRRKDSDLRYCSTECRPKQDPIKAIANKASWPPVLTRGAKMAIREGCLDCGTGLRLGRCKRHGTKRRLLLTQLRTRINWLLPRACRKCNAAFNRFDQGGVCDNCLKVSDSENNARRKARIRGAMRADRGISHRALHKMFNGICSLCNGETQRPEVWNGWDGKTWMPLAPTVDHIIPIARAGTHTWDNVQLAHWSCNSLKSAT